MKFSSLGFKCGLIIVLLLLAGCSDTNIDLVKKAYLDSSNTTTFSNVLDNKSYCEKVEWSVFNDNIDRVVVQYLCQVKNGYDHNKIARESFILYSNSSRDDEINKNLQSIEDAKHRLVENLNEINKKIEEADSRIEQVMNLIENPTPFMDHPMNTGLYAYLENLSHLFDLYIEDTSESNLFNLVSSNEFEMFLRQSYPFDYDSTVRRALLSQYHFMMQESDPSEREDYKLRNVQHHIDYHVSKIEYLIEHFDLAVQEAIDTYFRVQNDKLDYWENMKLDLFESIDSTNKWHLEFLAKFNDNIEKIKQGWSSEEIDLAAYIRFPVTGQAYQRFQWIVNNEGLVFLVYGDIFTQSEDGNEEIILRKYNRIDAAIASGDNPIRNAFGMINAF